MRNLFPVVVAFLAGAALVSVPRLLPHTDPRIAVRAVAEPVRVVSAPQSPPFARFGRGEEAGRVGRHVFFAARGVPPGPLVVAVRLEGVRVARTPAPGYRVFWTDRDWAFRHDGYVTLEGPPSKLVTPPFEPFPAGSESATLQLRLDLPDGAEKATVAELTVSRAPGVAVPVAIRGSTLRAFPTVAGEEIVLEVEPWGTGTFHTAVGVRFYSEPQAPLPLEIVATVSDAKKRAQRRTLVTIADTTGHAAFAPAWNPVVLRLEEWRGSRVKIGLQARLPEGVTLPAFTQICWAIPAVY